jgi:hypothetical protein
MLNVLVAPVSWVVCSVTSTHVTLDGPISSTTLFCPLILLSQKLPVIPILNYHSSANITASHTFQPDVGSDRCSFMIDSTNGIILSVSQYYQLLKGQQNPAKCKNEKIFIAYSRHLSHCCKHDFWSNELWRYHFTFPGIFWSLQTQRCV